MDNIHTLRSNEKNLNISRITYICIVKYLFFRSVNNIVDYGHIKAIKYTIGEDIDCKEVSSNTNDPMYCNGPLKPDTWYHVRMRAFTYGGYTDSDVFQIKTSKHCYLYT